MVIEQQKSNEIVLSKESLYDRNIVTDIKSCYNNTHQFYQAF